MRLAIGRSLLFLTTLVGVFGAAVRAQADHLLAAAVTPPGFFPDHDGPVLLYGFATTGPLSQVGLIPPPPDTLINDPAGVAFSAQGELFVGNRHRNGGDGSIARFFVDTSGNHIPNGNITGNGLKAVGQLAFSVSGELFAANFLNDTISRFVFDADGNAIPNGVIVGQAGSYLEGVAFSPSGELFVTTYFDVSRYIFDETGAAIFNGSFTIPGSTRLHQLAFSSQGELFLTSVDNDTVYRLLFDAAGNPVSNGTISVPTPVGITFSPEGELFVSSHLDNHLISRFTFDEMGGAISNGTVSTPDSMGGLAILP